MAEVNAAQQPNLVRLDERMAHVMRAIDQIQSTLETMPTRAEVAALVSRSEHSAAVVSLDNRIANLEARIRGQSPMSLLEVVQKIAVTVSALGASIALIVAVVQFLSRVPKWASSPTLPAPGAWLACKWQRLL